MIWFKLNPKQWARNPHRQEQTRVFTEGFKLLFEVYCESSSAVKPYHGLVEKVNRISEEI